MTSSSLRADWTGLVHFLSTANNRADIIDPRWIRMFDPRELQTLVGGLDTEVGPSVRVMPFPPPHLHLKLTVLSSLEPLFIFAPPQIDLSDLRNNTVVHGLSEATERAFWSVVKSFDPNQRRQLVSCPFFSPFPFLLPQS